MASIVAQGAIPPSLAKSTLHSVVACSSLDVLAQVRAMVNQTPGVDVIAECSTGKEALRTCLQQKPDLLFIDMQIGGYGAIEVAQALQSNAETRVLFVTGKAKWDSSNLDVQIFEYNATPLDESCISRAVQRARERIYQTRRGSNEPLGYGFRSLEPVEAEPEIEALPKDRMRRKLLVRDSGVIKVVCFDDIDWVDAAGDYMCIHAQGETLVMRSTMRDLIQKLDPRGFVQIHRSTVVNVDKIASITALPKGAGLLELSSGKQLKVSRNYRDAVRRVFG
jgi:two-component system LytT family response regulator